MLWRVFVIVLLLWLLGFGFSIGGSLIHILLVVAIAIVIWDYIVKKRRFA